MSGRLPPLAWRFIVWSAIAAASVAGCGRTDSPSTPSSSSTPSPSSATTAPADARTTPARPANVVLITIDTLRADHVGAYGWRAARTPAIDALAARGVRADRAFATAPITLASHASLLTGLYPPHHGARHNGMRLRGDVPTLAERLRARGFATGAFVAAFPLDRRFGLDRGFDVYSDALPRGPDGRPLNERPGRVVVDEALAWLEKNAADRPFFLWVHLFEPHAPYEADPAFGASPEARSALARYDDEIARTDAQVARIVQSLQTRLGSTLIVIAGDHGEAFGEHGEVGHSVFVYDTTLRVPLIFAGPGLTGGGAVLAEPVSLVDVLPTVSDLLGLGETTKTVDGVSLLPAIGSGAGKMAGNALPRRTLYAESFAPLLDFGWSPLRSIRDGSQKYIAAPKAELYDLASDPGETRNVLSERSDVASTLAEQVDRLSPADLTAPASAPGDGANRAASAAEREADARLRSLGYLAASRHDGKPPAANGARPDPKERAQLAARIAEVTSGELRGPALRQALEHIVAEDPKNGQMQMRLGYVLQEAGACREAVPHFRAAIAEAVPSADPGLGLAECLSDIGQKDKARQALLAADRVEPGNPIVSANLGMLALDEGRVPEAITRLRAALERAPDLHIARFTLARAYGRNGQRDEAAREARELLARLPPDAPQRAEVQRLLAAVQP